MIAAIIDVLNSMLLAINDFTHNYGLSIIVLTILVRLIMWPLMSKQLASAKAMQEIQPELKKIQEKYKHDTENLPCLGCCSHHQTLIRSSIFSWV